MIPKGLRGGSPWARKAGLLISGPGSPEALLLNQGMPQEVITSRLQPLKMSPFPRSLGGPFLFILPVIFTSSSRCGWRSNSAIAAQRSYWELREREREREASVERNLETEGEVSQERISSLHLTEDG